MQGSREAVCSDIAGGRPEGVVYGVSRSLRGQFGGPRSPKGVAQKVLFAWKVLLARKVLPVRKSLPARAKLPARARIRR